MARGWPYALFSTVLSLLLLLFADSRLHAQDISRSQARSLVISRFGIVATSQTVASQAGAAILDRGGSAGDAAIAANAVLGVIEPMMNGAGGDLFAIVYDAKDGKVYGLNSSGWSPGAATIESYRSRAVNGEIPPRSVLAVTVPGAVAGWEALSKRFGKLRLADVLTPAIYFARNGVPITEFDAAVWKASVALLQKQPGFLATYAPSGRAPASGEIFRDEPLAKSLELIARDGRNGFYRGATAERIVHCLNQLGNPMSMQDLDDFQPEWVEPISTTYRDWRVWELPPNGQGIAALSMLNIMEEFPLARYGHNSAEALHVMIEAKKLAYADLIKYVGDPRFRKIPVEELLSKNLGRQRAKLIQPNTARCTVLPSEISSKLNAIGKDTTYLSVVDREGNMVSLIQSNYSAFGTGIVAPGTGFVLHNRGASFTLRPGEPNSLEPHKRPLHTIIPAFMEKGGTEIAFGIMGGFNQAQAHAQFVSNVVDFGMNIQAALEAARFTKLTFEGCDVAVESGIPEGVLAQLRAKGHQLQVCGRFSQTMGRGNAVMRDEHGTFYGASDPRGDGEAIPQTAPFF
ncbi:MAG: gamma-glutamyltransferase [Acidobacteriaceae bacterium]|nr:gamma-glutamyltransferase [Acidobacteriaceae bacterium]